MSHHNVRSHTDLFTGIVARKIFSDLRKNDRNYLAGDSITYHEIIPVQLFNEEVIHFTGNKISALISHVITFEDYSRYLVGLEDHKDLVVLSIERIGLMIVGENLDIFNLEEG